MVDAAPGFCRLLVRGLLVSRPFSAPFNDKAAIEHIPGKSLCLSPFAQAMHRYLNKAERYEAKSGHYCVNL
jgi:hypothetical protein